MFPLGEICRAHSSADEARAWPGLAGGSTRRAPVPPGRPSLPVLSPGDAPHLRPKHSAGPSTGTSPSWTGQDADAPAAQPDEVPTPPRLPPARHRPCTNPPQPQAWFTREFCTRSHPDSASLFFPNFYKKARTQKLLPHPAVAMAHVDQTPQTNFAFI